ncbi:FixJ family two-component response regulator [Pararhizobium capsulatum DSM 1112]|uniref:FixJ family two-component response regulator n=1 Tax=Pararhizobium capsulatum DSM 1112 TaxID=1121113 RepID=A0ABU0C0U5_9HYPH|nr:response regulator [Pararhizobium capsulatum]MDQ0323822.1 FixJ family two-component response regulator [Pararhizobium capsulatum DSM 1112]
MENSPGTVAVVDDDPSMLRSVERLLTANGFMTEGYPSAEGFLRRAQLENVHCLVLDIHLGGMSGVELWNSLRQRGSNLPIIFMTAVEDETLERAAVDAGCVAYLRKPFQAKSLIAAVNRALEVQPLD